MAWIIKRGAGNAAIPAHFPHPIAIALCLQYAAGVNTKLTTPQRDHKRSAVCRTGSHGTKCDVAAVRLQKKVPTLLWCNAV